MRGYRIVIPAKGRVFIQYRQRFPWPCWRRMKRWYCDGFDIVSEKMDFPDIRSAKHWIKQASA